MRNTLTYRRRAATGLAVMTAGAASLVVGIAGPASAHGKEEPVEKPSSPSDKSCLELADLYQVDQDWTEFKITDLPEDDTETDFVVDDRGTEDTSDDAVVTITISSNGALLEWSSTIGIDAVYVNGSNKDKGSFFYIYARTAEDEEETSDFHLGVPPWDESRENTIESVSFCYDEEHETTPTTTPPTSETPSSSVPDTTVPDTSVPDTTVPDTTVPEDTTTTVEMATTAPPTTAPPTTEAPGGNLPHTGSNTGILVAVGAGLLLIGGALLASKRQIWKRFAR